MKRIELYGFSGKLGTGKNFLAEKVFLPMLPQKPTIVMAFADQLKIEGIVRDNLDRNKVFGEKDDFTRKALQRRGTEEGRMKYGEEIWVNFLREWILAYSARGIERFIITDLRFPNEFNFIKDNGGTTFRIEAPKRNLARLQREANTTGVSVESISSHTSETALDGIADSYDHVINNDPGENVFLQMRNITFEILSKNTEDLVIFSDLDDTICECHVYYMDVLEKVKNIIKENFENKTEVDKKKLANLDVDFEDSFNKHNGDYYKVPFYRDKFAESLMSVVKDFELYMNVDTNFEQIEEEAYILGLSVFDVDYKAIEGSVEAIREIEKLGRTVIFTIGDRAEQVKKISSLGLTDLSFEVFDHKDETLYRNLKNKYKSNKHVMIGDSYHRDIVPSLNVGFDLVIKIDKTKTDKQPEGYYCVKNLSDAKQLVEDFFVTNKLKIKQETILQA